jgi:flagellar hook-length control protein FliK
MTIEKSPTAVAPHKAAARADGPGGKAKSADDAPQGGGFTAILGAMGDAPVAAGPDAPQPDATTPQSTALDAATLLQQNPQIAAAQAQLAAAAAALTAATKANADSAKLLPGVAATDATLAALSGPGGSLPGQTLLPTDAAQATDASTAKRSGTLPTLAAATDSASLNAGLADTSTAGEPATLGLQRAAGHAKSGKDLSLAAADTAQASSIANAAASEKTEAVKWMAALDQAKAPQAGKAMESVFSPLLTKIEKSATERTTYSTKSAEPGYSGTTLGVSAPDFSQSGAATPITAPEMQVAEQVTYWVSHNVQNAELKLDGLGQSPVEVSISVQGKEAQITFRSDEAATRGVLEAAGAHLKDMLQREGMVLTGVSVGTSGSGDSSGAERRARQTARQGVIAPLQVASVATQDANRRANSVAGRSIDLFV